MKQTSLLLQQTSHQEEVRRLCWFFCLVLAHQTKKDLLPRVQVLQQQNQKVKKQTSQLLQQKSHQEEARHLCWFFCLVQMLESQEQEQKLRKPQAD